MRHIRERKIETVAAMALRSLVTSVEAVPHAPDAYLVEAKRPAENRCASAHSSAWNLLMLPWRNVLCYFVLLALLGCAVCRPRPWSRPKSAPVCWHCIVTPVGLEGCHQMPINVKSDVTTPDLAAMQSPFSRNESWRPTKASGSFSGIRVIDPPSSR